MNADAQPTEPSTQAAGTAAVHTVREADRRPQTQPQARSQMRSSVPKRLAVITAATILAFAGLATAAATPASAAVPPGQCQTHLYSPTEQVSQTFVDGYTVWRLTQFINATNNAACGGLWFTGLDRCADVRVVRVTPSRLSWPFSRVCGGPSWVQIAAIGCCGNLHPGDLWELEQHVVVGGPGHVNTFRWAD